MNKSEKTPVGELYGVGPAKAAAYEKLGIRTLHDLVFHFPRSYEHRGDIRLLSEAPPDARCGLLLTVGTEVKSARVRGRMSILKFKAFDESGVCEISYFNQEYLKKVFLPGLVFRFYGKVEQRGRRFLLNSPAYESYDENAPLPELLPVYRLSGALTQKLVEKMSAPRLRPRRSGKIRSRKRSVCVKNWSPGHGLCATFTIRTVFSRSRPPKSVLFLTSSFSLRWDFRSRREKRGKEARRPAPMMTFLPFFPSSPSR